MKEMNNQTNHKPLTVSREVQIGKTIYAVNSVFNGQHTLEEIFILKRRVMLPLKFSIFTERHSRQSAGAPGPTTRVGPDRGLKKWGVKSFCEVNLV